MCWHNNVHSTTGMKSITGFNLEGSSVMDWMVGPLWVCAIELLFTCTLSLCQYHIRTRIEPATNFRSCQYSRAVILTKGKASRAEIATLMVRYDTPALLVANALCSPGNGLVVAAALKWCWRDSILIFFEWSTPYSISSTSRSWNVCVCVCLCIYK